MHRGNYTLKTSLVILALLIVLIISSCRKGHNCKKTKGNLCELIDTSGFEMNNEWVIEELENHHAVFSPSLTVNDSFCAIRWINLIKDKDRKIKPFQEQLLRASIFTKYALRDKNCSDISTNDYFFINHPSDEVVTDERLFSIIKEVNNGPSGDILSANIEYSDMNKDGIAKKCLNDFSSLKWINVENTLVENEDSEFVNSIGFFFNCLEDSKVWRINLFLEEITPYSEKGFNIYVFSELLVTEEKINGLKEIVL